MKKVLAWMGRHWIITGILAFIAIVSIGAYEPTPDLSGLTCAEMQEKLAAQERETNAKKAEMDTINFMLPRLRHSARIGTGGPRVEMQIKEHEKALGPAKSAWKASQRKFEALYNEVAENWAEAGCKADE